MNWKHQSSRSPRSLDDLVTAAQHFLDQYYSSIKRLNSPGHELRWKEVLNEILSTGSYELKETELIFGAKLAWRNASRCIGRIQWSKLQVVHADVYFIASFFLSASPSLSQYKCLFIYDSFIFDTFTAHSYLTVSFSLVRCSTFALSPTLERCLKPSATISNMPLIKAI